MQQPGKHPRIQFLPKMLIDMSGTAVDQLMPALPLLFSFLFVFYQHHHKLIQIHMITVPVLLLLQRVHRKRLIPARQRCHGQIRRTQPCHLRQGLPDQPDILHFHTARFQRGTANAPALHIAQHFTVDRTDDLHIPRLPVIDLVTDTAVYRDEIPCLQQVRSPVCPHMHLSLDTIKNLRMVMPVDAVYHYIDHHHRNRNPQHIRRPVCLIISPHIHAPAFAACFLYGSLSVLCLLRDYSIIDQSVRILNAFLRRLTFFTKNCCPRTAGTRTVIEYWKFLREFHRFFTEKYSIVDSRKKQQK